MEIIVNSLEEFMGEQNVLTFDKVIETIYKELDIDLLNKEREYQERVICFERELYVKKLQNLDDEVYLKWGYNIEFLNQGKSIKLIRHGKLPFYVDSFNEMGFYPYNSPEFILEEKYYYPKDLDVFKKVKIRKRKLVCHYTKRETAIEKILPNKTLRFNEIKNSNDPWEYKKNILPISNNESDIFDAIGKSTQIQFNSQRAKYISFTKEIGKIRCFENMLMWAHYADKHKGICLVFDELKLWNLYLKQFKKERFKSKIVKYKGNAPQILVNGTDDPQNKVQNSGNDLFFTKNKAWKYESEYRLMLFPDGKSDTFLENLNEALVAIILGIDFPDVYKINIQELHRNYFPKAKLFQMHWDTDGYFRIMDLKSMERKYKCSEVLNDYLIEI
ncbi:MAG TPA: DUF2971 domain-containing protein [Draconibacterium sp.]|nr:DUF2971 domain-containing protein [Draconibacterium sp.]